MSLSSKREPLSTRNRVLEPSPSLVLIQWKGSRSFVMLMFRHRAPATSLACSPHSVAAQWPRCEPHGCGRRLVAPRQVRTSTGEPSLGPLPSTQEEVPATQLATLRPQEPEQSCFDTIPDAHSPKVDRSTVRAAAGEKRDERRH